jgi:hypothetical protein
MNNNDVDLLLVNCDAELNHINTLIISLGGTNLIVPYLNKYAVIKSCGTIEIAFKTLIADFCNKRSKQQVKNFINAKIRENSANPAYSRIISILKDFDPIWVVNFKSQMQAHGNYKNILTSIQSLVDARNDFSHGGNPTISFGDVQNYYNEAKAIILTLDNVIG